MSTAERSAVEVPVSDRRKGRRDGSLGGRRRYQRVFLDADWFAESDGCCTLGRGLEISPRGALLPIERTSQFTSEVCLYVSLPARPRMFKARGTLAPAAGKKGWVIRFAHVSPEDLTLLGHSLIEEGGLSAFPCLERKAPRFMDLHRRFLRTSI